MGIHDLWKEVLSEIDFRSDEVLNCRHFPRVKRVCLFVKCSLMHGSDKRIFLTIFLFHCLLSDHDVCKQNARTTASSIGPQLW